MPRMLRGGIMSDVNKPVENFNGMLVIDGDDDRQELKTAHLIVQLWNNLPGSTGDKWIFIQKKVCEDTGVSFQEVYNHITEICPQLAATLAIQTS
jgi:hypothetical protein